MKELYDNYIYAIAQGRTLDYINSLKQGAADARAELQALADSVGATLAGSSFIFNHGAAVPQGWEDPGQRGRLQVPPPPPRYQPDANTTEGQALEQKINAAHNKQSLVRRFQEACGKAAPYGSYNNHEFSFEELGGLVVVKCPAAFARSGATAQPFYLPPDCQQIDFSVYAALKIASFEDRPREILPFAKDFE